MNVRRSVCSFLSVAQAFARMKCRCVCCCECRLSVCGISASSAFAQCSVVGVCGISSARGVCHNDIVRRQRLPLSVAGVCLSFVSWRLRCLVSRHRSLFASFMNASAILQRHSSNSVFALCGTMCICVVRCVYVLLPVSVLCWYISRFFSFSLCLGRYLLIRISALCAFTLSV